LGGVQDGAEPLGSDDAVALLDPVAEEIDIDTLGIDGHRHPSGLPEPVSTRLGALDRKCVAV
jgi:hypothetical protein